MRDSTKLSLTTLAGAAALSLTVWYTTPAWPQDGVRGRMAVVEPGSPGCFAEILITDRAGIYNRDVTLETSAGDVVVRYTTRTNHADPDFAEIMSLPPDVVAQPPYLSLVPSETSVICLIEWQGM